MEASQEDSALLADKHQLQSPQTPSPTSASMSASYEDSSNNHTNSNSVDGSSSHLISQPPTSSLSTISFSSQLPVVTTSATPSSAVRHSSPRSATRRHGSNVNANGGNRARSQSLSVPKANSAVTALKKSATAARLRSNTMSPTTEVMRGLKNLTVTHQAGAVRSLRCPNRDNQYHACTEYCIWRYDNNMEGPEPAVPEKKPAGKGGRSALSSSTSHSPSSSSRSSSAPSSTSTSSSSRSKSKSKGKGGRKTSDTSERRKFHNERERKRRRDLRESFTRCRKAVPSISSQEGASDRKVLQEAQRYISAQKNRQAQLKQELSRRRIELVQNKMQAPDLFGGRKALEIELASLLIEEVDTNLTVEAPPAVEVTRASHSYSKLDQLCAAARDMDDFDDDEEEDGDGSYSDKEDLGCQSAMTIDLNSSRASIAGKAASYAADSLYASPQHGKSEPTTPSLSGFRTDGASHGSPSQSISTSASTSRDSQQHNGLAMVVLAAETLSSLADAASMVNDNSSDVESKAASLNGSYTNGHVIESHS